MLFIDSTVEFGNFYFNGIYYLLFQKVLLEALDLLCSRHSARVSEWWRLETRARCPVFQIGRFAVVCCELSQNLLLGIKL